MDGRSRPMGVGRTVDGESNVDFFFSHRAEREMGGGRQWGKEERHKTFTLAQSSGIAFWGIFRL